MFVGCLEFWTPSTNILLKGCLLVNPKLHYPFFDNFFVVQSDVNTVCFADESGHLIISGSDDNLCKVNDVHSLFLYFFEK